LTRSISAVYELAGATRPHPPSRRLDLRDRALGACSSGDTEVEGGGTAPTGPTATGPTATGPTGATSTGGAFDAPVSLDLSAKQNPTGASMYSCDGVEGTWTYEPGDLPIQGIEFTLDGSEVDMSGGDGTLVITGEITIPGWAARVSRTRSSRASPVPPTRRRCSRPE
jgi:hypothetical protein